MVAVTETAIGHPQRSLLGPMGAVQIAPEHLTRLHPDELAGCPSSMFRASDLAGRFFAGLLKTKRP
jgi:hypothetical protein